MIDSILTRKNRGATEAPATEQAGEVVENVEMEDEFEGVE